MPQMKTTRHAVAALASLAALAAVAPSAQAASCSRGTASGVGAVSYCPNYAHTIYDSAFRGVDTVRTTRSWFTCQARGGENPRFGVGRNNWWLRTKGDDHGRWGWFPANAIRIGGNYEPIAGVPYC